MSCEIFKVYVRNKEDFLSLSWRQATRCQNADCFAFLCPSLSCLRIRYPALLPQHALRCPAFPSPALPWHALPCPALAWPALPSLALPCLPSLGAFSGARCALPMVQWPNTASVCACCSFCLIWWAYLGFC